MEVESGGGGGRYIEGYNQNIKLLRKSCVQQILVTITVTLLYSNVTITVTLLYYTLTLGRYNTIIICMTSETLACKRSSIGPAERVTAAAVLQKREEDVESTTDTRKLYGSTASHGQTGNCVNKNSWTGQVSSVTQQLSPLRYHFCDS